MILLLLAFFLGDIIFALYIYVFESAKKDEFIEKLDSYHQISKLTRNLYQKTTQKLYIASKHYYRAQNNRSFNLSEIQGMIKESFKKFKNINNKEESLEIIYIFFKNIKEFREYLLGFIEAFILIDSYVSGLLNIENHDFREMNNLIEMMRIYENDLSRYENLQLEFDYTKTQHSNDIYFAFENCLLHFRTGIDVAYSKINEEKKDIKKSYEKKIKISYIIFSIIIILACISFFLIAISIFF
ncbi:MAG: hypothetical protein ACFFAN_05220 [Promethearchaeota archaeon]